MKRSVSLTIRYIIPVLSSCFLFSCASPAKKKGEIKSVLILGNSIVNHGYAPQIGWKGSWGMAASAQDSDFVHLLIKEIRSRDTTVKVRYSNFSIIETDPDNFNFSKLDSLKGPDMLIMRYSENVDDNTVHNGAFMRNYDKMIHYLDPGDKAVKVVVSGFWHRPVTNELLRQYAAKNHYLFVKNDDLMADSTNTAKGLFDNEGVAAHPSDKGMRLIKERIWEKINGYFP